MDDRPDALIWSGPVYSDTPTKVAWQHPTEVIALPCEGSTNCSNMAEQYRGADGKILAGVLAKAGKTRDKYRKVAVAGFSAAHGFMPKLLDADGDDISACVAIDSCFSAMGSLEKAGYVSFAKRAAMGTRLMVFTVGPGGGVGSGATVAPGNADFSTAIDCVMAQVGSAVLSPTDTPPNLPAPQVPFQKSGGIYVLDYREYRHDQHIGSLAVPVMDAYLAPYLGGSLQVSLVPGPVAALVTAFLGFFGGRWLLRNGYLDFLA